MGEVGLLYPSVVTGIIRTVKQEIVIRRLGILPKNDFIKAQEALERVLAIP